MARLATELEADENYRVDHNDFYFDRNASAFADILEYYRCGELHLNQTTCGAIFKTVSRQKSQHPYITENKSVKR